MPEVQQEVAPPLASEDEVQRIYSWIDEIPLSRPKRSISRDFADGVLCAEVCKHFFPNRVDLHNYSPANSLSQKRYNWNHLNEKCLKKFGLMLHSSDVERCIRAEPGAVERVLGLVMTHLYTKKRRIQAAGVAGGYVGEELDSPQQEAASPGAYASPQGAYANAAASPGSTYSPQAKPSRPASAAKAGEWSAKEQRLAREVDTEILVEKEHTIHELRETVMIMSEKIRKLEQLVRIKDTKIDSLNAKLERANAA